MTWKEQFTRWAQPPSQAERERMENAEHAIRDAVAASPALQRRNVRVFAQGSYRNKTHIRQESDVDICVLCSDTYYLTLPEGYDRSQFGLGPASYHDAEYRRDVEQALISRFGAPNVKAGNKAWDIHENSYRVDADVVAAFEHRQYFVGGAYRSGVAVLPQSGSYVLNYPEQNYANGKAKNDVTSKRFRAIVRIVKNLYCAMKENNVSCPDIPSYLLECLVYLVPNEAFGHYALADDLRWVLAYLCNETRADESCKDWTEVNEYKYLFHVTQKWTRQPTNAFLNAAWTYVGYQ